MYDPYAHNDDDGKDHPEDIIEDMMHRHHTPTRIYRCGNCGETGHNARTCTKPSKASADQ